VYSTNGGATFSELTAGLVFPAPKYATGPTPNACNPACDQVVAFDRFSGTFIWVLQYAADAKTNDDLIRVAFATPADLARSGAKAWRRVDLSSLAIYGPGKAFDQPRLGLTPGYLYISFNQPTGAIIRIRQTALEANDFQTVKPLRLGGSTSPVEAVRGSTDFLRVARSVNGDREYFVGLRGGNSSALVVASIADDESTLESALVNTWSRADGNSTAAWSSITPSGQNWLARMGNRTQTNVTGVTMAGDGSIWAAWSESRDILDPKDHTKIVNTAGNLQPGLLHTYPQPHIGVAQLLPQRVTSTDASGPLKIVTTLYWFEVGAEDELVNQHYALSMPDLATDAGGDVAMSLYGGGGNYYVNHAVGFITPTRAELVDDATGTTDTSDGTNDYGDYQTIRPDAAPYGNCMVSSTVVTAAVPSTTSPTKSENQLIMTLFGRPGASCPKTAMLAAQKPGGTKPKSPSASVLATSLTLKCPSPVQVGSANTVQGSITPSLPNATIGISTAGGANGDATSTTVDGSGAFEFPFKPLARGAFTLTAAYVGNAAYKASSATCTSTVAGYPSTLTLTAPSAPVSLGSAAPVQISLSLGTAGQTIAIGYTGPDGKTTTDNVTTDASGKATDSFKPTSSGTWTAKAHYDGTATNEPADSAPATFKVSPGRTTLTLTSSDGSSLGQGQTLHLVAKLAPNDTNVATDKVTLSYKGPDLVARTQQSATAADGAATFTLTLDQAGTWTFQAHYAGSTTLSAADSSTVSVDVNTVILSGATVTCPTAPVKPPPQTVVVTVSVQPPRSGTPVTVTWTPPAKGTAATHQETTDASGTATDGDTVDASGTWTVAATFAGDTTRTSSKGSCTFNVLLP
jgi:hypothetical protein